MSANLVNGSDQESPLERESRSCLRSQYFGLHCSVVVEHAK